MTCTVRYTSDSNVDSVVNNEFCPHLIQNILFTDTIFSPLSQWTVGMGKPQRLEEEELE